MSDKVTISIAGVKELGDALDEMKKSTAKGVMQRTLKEAATPVQEHAASLTSIGAQRSTQMHRAGRLKHIGWRIGTKLNPSQKAAERMVETTSFAVVFVGAAPYTEAITEEFGTIRGVRPHPMLRPAWDAQRLNVLARIISTLKVNIEKTRARAARREALKAQRLA